MYFTLDKPSQILQRAYNNVVRLLSLEAAHILRTRLQAHVLIAVFCSELLLHCEYVRKYLFCVVFVFDGTAV